MKTPLRNWPLLAMGLLMMLGTPAAGEPGDLDMTFNGTGKLGIQVYGPEESAAAVAIQRDGKIVVGGHAYQNVPGGGSDMVVMRINPNGTLDTTFNRTGIVTTDLGSQENLGALAIQPDGKILAAGTDADVWSFNVVRYNANGSLDSTFAGTGTVITPVAGATVQSVTGIAVQTAGKIVVGGSIWMAEQMQIAVLRYQSNGTLDPTFGGTGIVTTSLGSRMADPCGLVLQSDGKIVVGGSAMVRYHPDGTLDQTFGAGGIVITPRGVWEVMGMTLQTDGKIVLAGSAWGTVNEVALHRYLPNGTLDSTFNGTGSVTTQIEGEGAEGRAVTVQRDGKIVVVGDVNQTDHTYILVARYNGNGSLDATFNDTGVVITRFAGETIWSWAAAVVLQPDGKIVAVGGESTSAGNQFAIARYLASATEGTARFSAPVYVVSEKSPTAVLTVQRINAYKGTLVVNYETSDGTAGGSDYVAASGTLIFGPGQRSKTIRLTLLPDQIIDGGETVKLTLKSAAGRIIDTTTVVLRENALAVAPRKVRPGQRITLVGAFDATQPLSVRFTDFSNNNTVVLASDVTARSAKVRVPIFVDAETLEPDAVKIAVQTEQGTMVAGPVANVQVLAPSETGQPAGVFALEYLKAIRKVCSHAEENLLALDSESAGAVDSTEFRLLLTGIQELLQPMEDELQAVIDGTSSAIELGTIGSEMVTLDSTGLSLLDRMIVAAVFEGKFKPATAGLMRLRSLIAVDPTLAAALPNATDDLADAMDPALQSKVAGVFDLTRKIEEMAQTHIGKASEWTERYLGNAGPPVAADEQVFSATYWLASLQTPALVSYYTTAASEPYIRAENRRAVAPGDIDGQMNAAYKGFADGLRADYSRVARAIDLLNTVDRQGTFYWDRVSGFDTEWILRQMNPFDPLSLPAKWKEARDIFWENFPAPIVSIEPGRTVIEPRTGSLAVPFLVSLSRWPKDMASVQVNFESGSATAGVDFTPSEPLILLFRPYTSHERYQWVVVRVNADQEYDEETETFRVTLSAPLAAKLGSSVAESRILDSLRHWAVVANVSVQDFGNYPISQEFGLPRSGGTVKFSLFPYNAYAIVQTTATTMKVTAGGFQAEGGVKVTGEGRGQGPIIPSIGGTVEASGPISGMVYLTYPDCPPEPHKVTGTFGAHGSE